MEYNISNHTVESPRGEKLDEMPDYETPNGVSRFGITVNPLNDCNLQSIHRAYSQKDRDKN